MKQQPKVFVPLLGIGPEKFDELASLVHPLCLKAETRRLRCKKKIKKGSERRYGLTFEESLAMLLLHTRTYVTHVFLSVLFNTHESGICRYFARLPPSVEVVFDLPIKKVDISKEEILELVVDATEQSGHRFKDPKRLINLYSGTGKATLCITEDTNKR